MDRYDILIIGGGQAGIPLAHALAAAGKNVALAERKDLGGSCVNFGCTPTKAVIASARAAFQARRGAVFGLRIPTVEVDYPAVLDRARSIVMQSRGSLQRGFVSSKNLRLLAGHARLRGREGAAFRIRLGDEDVLADRVILNTGARSHIPPIPGLKKVDYLHAGNWLDEHSLPQHVAFIGAGYIALEMSQFYLRMGCRVTVVEKSDRILQKEDEDVVFLLQRLLESEGVEFRLTTEITRIEPRRGGAAIVVRSNGFRGEIVASRIFVGAGRLPNTDDLGLETIGVKTSKEGFVEVDERLATNVPGVWAAGDIRGGPMFTHTSWDDYRILNSQFAGDGSRTTRRVVPYAVYTDPELGRVGQTETAAREGGAEIKVGRYEMRNNGKARETSETEGVIKIVVEAASGRILGAAVLASDGAELVHMCVDVMNADAPYTVLRDAIHIHPTLAEAVQSAVLSIR
jgi:pyruvate/2-oxoglutarate dehydrogenase complex dihydrolipoamide dehydrogenase (E3) component